MEDKLDSYADEVREIIREAMRGTEDWPEGYDE